MRPFFKSGLILAAFIFTTLSHAVASEVSFGNSTFPDTSIPQVATPQAIAAAMGSGEQSQWPPVIIPEGCSKDDVSDVFHILSDYQTNAFLGNTKVQGQTGSDAANLIYQQIKAKLQGLEAANSPCFDSVADAYLLGSLQLLETLYSRPLTFIGTVLVDHYPRRVHYLTSTVRNDSGCIWPEKTAKGGYQILGGYDCSQSAIYIDPYLPPLNLGAAFAHEVDHLFRDKLGNSTWNEIYKNDPALGLLQDEVFANVFGAFLQRRLEVGDYESGQTPVWLSPIQSGYYKKDHHHKSFDVDFDFDLFSRGGNLSTILSSQVSSRTSISNFLQQSGFLNCGSSNNFSKDKNRIENIYGIVSQRYFQSMLPEIGSTVSSLGNSTSIVDCTNYDPLAELIQSYDGADNRAHNDSPFTDLIPKLIQISSSLDSPSQSCQLMAAPMQNGGVKNYLGAKSDSPSCQGSHPGAEGSRPGAEGSRPGAEGSRPSTNSTLCAQPEQGL